MEVVKIFDDKFQNLAQSEPRILDYVDNVEATSSNSETQLSTTEEIGDNGDEKKASPDKSSLSCSTCKVQFANVAQQREHFKLDWHRYNLQRNLNGQPTVTEVEFEEKEDVSSISGSESESEELQESKSSTYLGQNQGRVYLATTQGQIFLLHRCLLAERKQDIVNLRETLAQLVSAKWCVLLLGGGHFAGAIFDGSAPILHKTFHCYTVRAGQGGSQSSRDNRNASSAPKSAGASLRRYNEQAFVQHVTDTLDLWREELARCTLIPFRAAGPYNKSVLFGGKNPILQRSDSRLRVIPFATRRATFKEVKRVQEVLTSVTVYDSFESIPRRMMCAVERGERKRNRSKTGSINRARSRESVERPLPCPLEEDLDLGDACGCASMSDADLICCATETDLDLEFSMESLEISFKDTLEQFGDSLTLSDRMRKPKKSKSSENMRLHLERQARIKAEKERAKVEKELRIIMLADVMTNNKHEFERFLKSHPEAMDFEINKQCDTVLHLCADLQKHDFINILLEHGANVCTRNTKNQTPYTITQDEATREVFRKFAQRNPEKFNYDKAHIPLRQMLSQEELEAKKLKQKQLRKTKREKAKEKQKLKQVEKEEQEERDRFTMLSDREKRALAAERRILDANGAVTSRCFLCGADIGGRVPFEYSTNRFCSMDCLKAHRIRNPVVLS